MTVNDSGIWEDPVTALKVVPVIIIFRLQMTLELKNNFNFLMSNPVWTRKESVRFIFRCDMVITKRRHSEILRVSSVFLNDSLF